VLGLLERKAFGLLPAAAHLGSALLFFRTEVENCAGPAGEEGVAGKQKQTDISHQEQQLKALKIIFSVLDNKVDLLCTQIGCLPSLQEYQ
jgi:hypothetical protein